MLRIKDKLIWFLGVLMLFQLGTLTYGAVECVNYAKRFPEQTRETCLKLDATLQKAVETYLAVILALMVPTKPDDR